MVLGHSVYYQISQGRDLFATIPAGASLLDYERVNPNMERTDYTKAISKARELAVNRLQSEAKYLQADGIVGVSIKKQVSLRASGLLIEFLALGTAVISSEIIDSQADYMFSLDG